VYACILCPSKILKNQTMVDVHLKSSVSILARWCPPTCGSQADIQTLLNRRHMLALSVVWRSGC
jgi:hypothetical protein